jgi:hypothetical protein
MKNFLDFYGIFHATNPGRANAQIIAVIKDFADCRKWLFNYILDADGDIEDTNFRSLEKYDFDGKPFKAEKRQSWSLKDMKPNGHVIYMSKTSEKSKFALPISEYYVLCVKLNKDELEKNKDIRKIAAPCIALLFIYRLFRHAYDSTSGERNAIERNIKLLEKYLSQAGDEKTLKDLRVKKNLMGNLPEKLTELFGSKSLDDAKEKMEKVVGGDIISKVTNAAKTIADAAVVDGKLDAKAAIETAVKVATSEENKEIYNKVLSAGQMFFGSKSDEGSEVSKETSATENLAAEDQE